MARNGGLVSAYYWGLSDWQLIAQAPGLWEPLSSFGLFAQIGEPGESAAVSMAFDDFRYAPIPEPATLTLIGAGLGTLGLAVRRREK